jgi:aconitase A
VKIIHADGTSTAFDAICATETQFEIDLLRDGGVIPHILLNATRKAA